MGVLRFIFAICVIVQHTAPLLGFRMLDGLSAVQSFFIISGFYMSLVINEKYIGEKRSYKLFITNRLLRLYPCYWATLLLTLILFLYQLSRGAGAGRLQYFIDNFAQLPLITSLSIILSNLFMFGMDVFNFISFDPIAKNFYFGTFADPENHRGFNFLLVRQAWTIGVELAFYLVAPFILERKKILIVVVIIIFSFTIRFLLIYNKLYFNFWRGGFFPAELGVFLFGFLSYLIYQKIKGKTSDLVGLTLTLIIVLIALYYKITFLNFNPNYKWIFFVMILFSIPFIFEATKKSKWDRLIGELSYPMYISHFLIIHLYSFSFFKSFDLAGFTVLGTIIISIFLVAFIANPVEKFRQERVKRKEIKDMNN